MLLLRASSIYSKLSGLGERYTGPEKAPQDVFDYNEIFYNPKYRHFNIWMLSLVEFELAIK